MAQKPAIELTTDMDDRWRMSAACRDLDTDLFFPVGTTGEWIYEISQAKGVCRACPVISPCLEFALVTNQECGVWGGTSEDERRSLRRSWLRIRRDPVRGPIQIARGRSEAS